MLKVLKDCLVSQGRAALIAWIRQVLLAPAGPAGRLPGENVPGRTRTGNIGRPQEPIWFYYNKANQSILLDPWNRFQYQGLQTEAFILLLHKLGFQLPADVGKVFPRLDFLGKQDFCHHHHYCSPGSPTSGRRPHLLGGGQAGSGGHEEVEVLAGGVGEDKGRPQLKKKRFLSGIAQIRGGGSTHARIFWPPFFSK